VPLTSITEKGFFSSPQPEIIRTNSTIIGNDFSMLFGMVYNA
jgi:hypothetical protein